MKLLRRLAVYVVYLAPFILLYWLYEHVRALAVSATVPVHYEEYVRFEERLFGIPLSLWFASHRNLLFDVVAGVVYALHPVYFIVFAIVVMLKRLEHYGRLVLAFTLSSAVAVLVYALYPTEPPWMVFVGVERPPNLILKLVELVTGAKIDPNPYAAMPSMHVCMAVIFSVCLWRMCRGRVCRVAAVSWPLLMAFSTIYTVNHYLADVIAGAALGIASCAISDHLLPRLEDSGLGVVVRRWLHRHLQG